MDNKLRLTTRELTEIHHSLWYERFGNHGTVGHNILIILAKMARHQGFYLNEDGAMMTPDHVENIDK